MNADSGSQRLQDAAHEIYHDLRLAPVLRRLLDRSGQLVGAAAGSVSLVDRSRHRYLKVAERGASCQLGRSFPLDEGISGQVVALRRPVVLDSYADLPRGHLTAGHPAEKGAAAGIPIWWCGDVIGVNVLFAGGPHQFSGAEIDELELVTQLAAAGIVQASAGDPTLSDQIRSKSRLGAAQAGPRTVVTEVGHGGPISPTVSQVALDLVSLAEVAAARRQPDAQLHVAVVHRDEGLRLMVHDRGDALVGVADPEHLSPGWRELADTAGGGVSVEHVPGWGTLLRADLPYDRKPETIAEPTPFTPREQDVLSLLAEGASDKEVAHTLVISTKTVQKHVGALLRKTGAASRTAALVRAMERGWLPPAP